MADKNATRLMAADSRQLEKVKNNPGVYRRHASGCDRRRCRCPYVVRWKSRGKSHKQMFPTLDLAREFKGKLDSHTGARQPLSSSTVADYYEAWIDNYRGRTSRGLEESTRREYRTSFRFHVLPLPIARMRMRDLGAPDIADWFSQLERRGVSPTTIRKAKAALAVMLASAVQSGDLASNPAASVRYVPSAEAKRRHPKRHRRKLTAADVTAILAVMDERWQMFFMLLVESGVRIGELFGLTWRNVHLGDDPHIFIAEQVYKGERKQLKTDASMAKVPLSASMTAWLAKLRPEGALDEPVFPSSTGTPLTYSNAYNRVLRPALQRSGIAVRIGENDWDYQGVAFHAFRKACGSLLLANGKNIKQVQGWLRHSQLTTTLNVYIHDTDDGLGSADMWDDLLSASGGPKGGPKAADPPSDDEQKTMISRGFG